MEKVRFCEACGTVLILNKEHHKIVRDDTETGLPSAFKTKQEPKYYNAFDCDNCGCQTIMGERKREVHEIHFEDAKEDIKVKSEFQDDLADIKKKIEEAGE